MGMMDDLLLVYNKEIKELKEQLKKLKEEGSIDEDKLSSDVKIAKDNARIRKFNIEADDKESDVNKKRIENVYSPELELAKIDNEKSKHKLEETKNAKKINKNNNEKSLDQMKFQLEDEKLRISNQIGNAADEELENIGRKFQQLRDVSLNDFAKELINIKNSMQYKSNEPDLNSNVDELIKIKAPYGETIKNYERLTEYLSRANKIHSKISKTMKR